MKKDIIKAQADSLMRSFKTYNKSLTYSEALETLAQLYEFKDYNTFSDWMKKNPDFATKLTTQVNNKKLSLFVTEKPAKATKYLSKPISKKVLAAKIANKDLDIKETIIVGFFDLMEMNIDSFNDYAQENILGDNAYNINSENEDLSVVLTDIRYNVVGHVKGEGYDAGNVLVEVHGVLDVM